jgi:hypothetical protein
MGVIAMLRRLVGLDGGYAGALDELERVRSEAAAVLERRVDAGRRLEVIAAQIRTGRARKR